MLRNNIIYKIYLKLFPLQLLFLSAPCISRIIGNCVISKFCNRESLAAFAVISPLSDFISIVATLISSGTIILCGVAMWNNDSERKSTIFSTSVFLAGSVGLLFFTASLIIPGYLAKTLGATNEIIPLCRQYIYGNLISYIFLAVLPILNVLLQIAGKWKTVIFSSFLLMAISSVFNIVFIVSLNLPFYYIGISNSISTVIAFTVLFISYLKSEKDIRFSFKLIKAKTIKSIFTSGSVDSIPTIMACAADIIVNVIVAKVGGTDFLASIAIIGTVNSFSSMLFTQAFVTVTLMIASSFIGENDRNSFTTLVKKAFGIAFCIGLFLYAALFTFAPVFSHLFSTGNYDYNTNVIKVYYLGILFFPLFMCTNTFLSSQKKSKIIFISSIINNILACTLFYLIPTIFGKDTIWYGCLAVNVMYVFVMLIISTVYNRHIPRSFSELVCMNSDFGVDRENTYAVKISTVEDAISSSKQTMEFLGSRGISSSNSFKCGLCIEEMLCNIIEHGFTKDKKMHAVELTVILNGDKINFIIRDDCIPFDPKDRFSEFDINNPEKGIGIRMVMKLAEKVDYRSIYGLNVLRVTI